MIAPLLVFVLTETGHEVLCANNGLDGLEILAKSLPDVVLTDRRLPGMSGVEFARAVRASGIANDIPLVLLSAFVEDLTASERELFALVLTKPISAEGLLAKVEEIARVPC